MMHELKLERLLDAPPELVFDTFVDPDAQAEMFDDSPPGYRLTESSIDLRVGGTWTMVQEGEGQTFRLTYVFTEIDRPRRIVADMSMHYGGSGKTETSIVSLAFDDQDGKTLVTLVQSGFETEEERDAYLQGAPGFLDALQRAVAKRVAEGRG
jgi:uncharacterized protein YndB with AHSA1/START domain